MRLVTDERVGGVRSGGRFHQAEALGQLRRGDRAEHVVNDAVLRSCKRAGFVPHREHAAPGTAVLLALVAAGFGVAVVPASVRALPLQGLVFRDLADAGSVELALAWRRGGDNPVVDAVIKVLSSAFGLAFAPTAVEELL